MPRSARRASTPQQHDRPGGRRGPDHRAGRHPPSGDGDGLTGRGQDREAYDAATAAGSTHECGPWWVDLADSGSALDGLAESVSASIGPEPAILILDNADRCVALCADLAHRLLADCPGLAVLVTSRQRIGIAGEVVTSVEPLPAEAAVAVLRAGKGGQRRPRHRRPFGSDGCRDLPPPGRAAARRRVGGGAHRRIEPVADQRRTR